MKTWGEDLLRAKTQPRRVSRRCCSCAHNFNESIINNKHCQATKFIKLTMSQMSTAHHYQQASTEMLASAMMLVSLSESAVVNPGFKSSFSSRAPSSCNSSASSLSGWGSPMTRKSYKVDLCSLGSSPACSEAMSSTPINDVTCVDPSNDSWGFYADTQ